MACTHPSTTYFRTNHGRLGIRCEVCGSTAIAGDPLWLSLLKDIRRRLFG